MKERIRTSNLRIRGVVSLLMSCQKESGAQLLQASSIHDKEAPTLSRSDMKKKKSIPQAFQLVRTNFPTSLIDASAVLNVRGPHSHQNGCPITHNINSTSQRRVGVDPDSYEIPSLSGVSPKPAHQMADLEAAEAHTPKSRSVWRTHTSHRIAITSHEIHSLSGGG